VKTAFRKSFQRDLKSLKKNREMLGRIRKKIEDVEKADALEDLPGIKKLSGGDDFYRIRVGDYRIGLGVDDGLVVFVRCLHRRDIYRYFPRVRGLSTSKVCSRTKRCTGRPLGLPRSNRRVSTAYREAWRDHRRRALPCCTPHVIAAHVWT